MRETPFPDELESLRDELQRIALAPTFEGPHTERGALLYHYTDENGARGIISSGTLWATCLPYLRDKHETEYPISSCRKYLETRQEESGVRGRFIRAALAFVRNDKSKELLHCLEEQAATCLSKRIDIRSQWEEYASGGRGYALGFSSNGVFDILVARTTDRDSKTDVNWALRAMVYDAHEQQTILGDLLDKIFACPFFRNPGSEEIRDLLIALAVSSLAIAAAGYKDPAYAAEHEIRLTVANHIELSLAGTALPTKRRSIGDREVRYMEVDLRRPESGHLPLTDVVMGPECDPKNGERVVKSILDAVGYSSAQRPRVRHVRWDEMQ